MAKRKPWYVVTSSGLPVFEGSRGRCYDYVVQALRKGSPSGFLSVVRELPTEEVSGDG